MRKRTTTAFTLPELLVVIGIIGIILGFLMPVLGRTRAASSNVGCANNLRQWATAAQLFDMSNDDSIPRRGQGVQPTNQIARPDDWFNALPLRVSQKAFSDLVADNNLPRPGGANSIWLCPAARPKDGPYFWSYGMNMSLSVQDATQNNGQPDKINAVGNPSTMVFMADGPGNYCSVFPSKYPDGYNPVARHKGYAEIAFLDGHVAAFTASDIGIGTGLVVRNDVRWHPPNSTWNGAQ